MNHLSSQRERSGYLTQNHGFTLIELLVSISIIALLMALILPAVQSARESARRMECGNHVKNLALGMHGFLTTRNQFPAGGYWGGGPSPDKNNPGPHHNWVVDLLPYVDRRDLADRWDWDQLATFPANQDIANTHVKVFTCPSDTTTTGDGDLSYAVNGGIGDSFFYNGVQDEWHCRGCKLIHVQCLRNSALRTWRGFCISG